MAEMPKFVFVVAALVALGTSAEAQPRSWPARLVKLVVSTPPGSGQDLIARTLTEPCKSDSASPSSWKTFPVPAASGALTSS
jgi:tripartite-type tricarboxylate transporter receptor subunit TctC